MYSDCWNLLDLLKYVINGSQCIFTRSICFRIKSIEKRTRRGTARWENFNSGDQSCNFTWKISLFIFHFSLFTHQDFTWNAWKHRAIVFVIFLIIFCFHPQIVKLTLQPYYNYILKIIKYFNYYNYIIKKYLIIIKFKLLQFRWN